MRLHSISRLEERGAFPNLRAHEGRWWASGCPKANRIIDKSVSVRRVPKIKRPCMNSSPSCTKWNIAEGVGMHPPTELRLYPKPESAFPTLMPVSYDKQTKNLRNNRTFNHNCSKLKLELFRPHAVERVHEFALS